MHHAGGDKAVQGSPARKPLLLFLEEMLQAEMCPFPLVCGGAYRPPKAPWGGLHRASA